MADDSTIVLGTRVETREALAGIQRFATDAGEELRDLAAGGDGDARKLLLDTEEAEASIRRVEQEFRETGRTSEEALRQAEEGLRRVSGALGFEKDLRLVPPEFEDISRASKDAGSAVERFGKLAETGGRGAQRSAAQAQIAIDRLEAAIETARRTGGPVSPEWERRLVSLREEMRRGVETAGRFAAAQKDVQDELAASTERAAAFDEQATSLTEAIIKRFPKAQAAVVGFGAALGTLQVAYSETRQFVSFMKERFGVDIDQAVQESIQGWALLVDEIVNGEERAQQAAERTANAARVAQALNLERARAGTEAIADAQALLAEFEAVQQRIHQINQSGTQGLRDLSEAVAGIKTEDLEARLTRTLEIIDSFDGNFQALAASPAFPAFADEVRKLAEILDKQGAALRANLSGQELLDFDAAVETFQRSVRAKLGGTVAFVVEAVKDLLAAFGVQTPEAIRKSTESLRGLIEVYGGLGKVTQEQATQVAAEADRILKAIALLPVAQREALADITASLHATADAYREHAASVEAFSASGTEAVERATEARIAAWEREQAALDKLSETAGSAREKLLAALKPHDSPPGRRRQVEEPEEAEEEGFSERRESDLQRLKDGQREATASSDEVAQAIARFREELSATGTVLSELDQGAIAAFLGRLQQTADEGGATAAVIEDAFASVQHVVDAARQRAAELNGVATQAEEVARKAASQAKALGAGVQDIVGSVDAAGQTLISNLETAVDAGNKLIERTVDTGKQATGDVVAVVVDGQKVITQAGSATAEFLDKYATGAQVIAETVAEANTGTQELAQGATAAGAAVGALATDARTLGMGMAQVAQETEKAGQGLGAVADSAESAGEGLKLIASHAASAAEPLAGVAAGLQSAAASEGPLHSTADAVHAMAQDAPGLADDLSRLEPVAKIQERAEALKLMAIHLTANAVAAERLRAALKPETIREEADALNALADALERVAQGLEAERTAREGEGAPN